ncbi:outer membrane beta-barrel protein [Pontibacter qinzhouensis]|uniref:Outer membrane beta-barrel protein n=1 Tax=Pontibacter qinzhouensis TaxID=2603253 RepID=A0A5C8K6A0_9BACT|nr:TonB-dependent receptor [Pontibacter qinzhouensis]TXK45786.1 outer membrane beta-barrel protein [Pontibacter qinzhouensis]
MKKILLLLIMLISYAQASAQTRTYTVSGTVKSQQDNITLPGASVVLTRATDAVKTGAATDPDGNFTIENVAPGEYTLSINYVGFKAFNRTVRVQNSNVNMGQLPLEDEAITTRAVEVVGRVPLGEQKGDTTAFNARAFKTAPDASVEDLVTKMPGITIQDGVIQAQGEEIKQIMIDGKRYGGTDVSSALRNLPSDMIESVEVFDRQSDQAAFSGFEDGNREKTLNFVTRKDRRKGQSGKISAGYGTDDRYMVGAAVNFFDNNRKITLMGLTNNINMFDFSIGETPGGGMRGRRGGWGGGSPNGIISTNTLGFNYNDMWGKKIEVSSSYNFNSRDVFNRQTAIRDYTAGDQVGNQLLQRTLNNDQQNSHRFNFRLQYNINENNRLLITPNITLQKNNTYVDGLTELYDPESALLTNARTTNTTESTNLNFSNNILYSHRFGKPGRVFTTNINTTYSSLGQDNFFTENTQNNLDPSRSASRNQYSDISRDNFAWSGSASLSEKVGANALVQMEYTIGNQSNDSDRRTFDRDPESEMFNQLNEPLSNTFKSNYLAQSIGPSYQYRNDKTRLQVNAKYQYATLESNTVYPEPFELKRHFSNILPSAEIEHKFSPSRSLNINLRTGTNVPSAEQLQEVLDISNPLQVSIGNANLDQDYQNRLFVRYRSFNAETNRNFFMGLFGTATQNYIGNSVYERDIPGNLLDGYELQPGARLVRRENMDGFWNVRTFFNYGQPVNLLSSNINLRGSVGYTRTPGRINNETNFANRTDFGVGVNLSSNISENIDFNIGTNSSYNIVKNTLAASSRNNNNFFTQNSNMRLSWILWKGFVYRTELNHQYNTGATAGASNNFLLWNMSMGKKFLKDNKGEISLSVNDLLDKNDSFQQNITESYAEDVRSTVLRRFFMLTFTYNIRSYAGGQSQEENPGRGNFPPGGGPGRF